MNDGLVMSESLSVLLVSLTMLVAARCLDRDPDRTVEVHWARRPLPPGRSS